jgi:Uma2 family endonuclease
MVGTRTPTPEAPAAKTQRVTLNGVSWQTYTQLLAELGDQRASRLAYDQGVLEITMPSDRHETHKKLLERMVETLTEELEQPAKSFGSTTLNREDLERGAEPDSCYYIQNVSQIEGRQVDLTTDPPPDLVIEVDISSPSSRWIDIYRQLGVPEI